MNEESTVTPETRTDGSKLPPNKNSEILAIQNKNGRPESVPPSRRNFLRLSAGVALAGGLTALGLSLSSERKEQEVDVNIFEPTEHEFMESVLEQWGFNAEAVVELMKEHDLPRETYGILAASGASLFSVEQRIDEISFGSAGVIRHQEQFHLITTMHVIKNNILQRDTTELYISIPGLELQKGKLREIITYSRPSLSKDETIIIPLNDEMQNKLRELEEKGLLTALTLQPFSSHYANSGVLFRYQGNSPGLHSVNFEREDLPTKEQTDSVRRIVGGIQSGEKVVCGGVSGSPIIIKDGDTVSNNTYGVVSHRMFEEDQPDQHGVLGDHCTSGVGIPSPSEGLFKTRAFKRSKI
ncbi:MAG: twin-arginine translocation signal domain-containing protein [Patescibacteria group bacterium]